tara:strand:- start:270 stop:455 length:186 start_codon:yes stop_codon:yes gene_type:complete
MNDENNLLINTKNIKEWYLKKGLILIDIFIIIALMQYYIFDGSFNEMIFWIKNYLNFIIKM